MRIKSDFVIHDFGMEFLGCIETIQKKTKQNRARTSNWYGVEFLGCIETIQKNIVRTKPDFLIHDYGMEFLGYIGTIQKKNEMECEQTLIF